MHIPDGFLDGRTAALAGALAAGALALAVRRLRQRLPRRQVPLLGLAAAFVFVAQMLNFPIAGGTSGHLVGGTLIAVLLGPGAAVLVLTAVLIVQCLVFADGGLLALGANVLNMGVMGGIGGYAIYRLVRRLWVGPRGMVMGAAFAAWCSVVAGAVLAAGELAGSGTVPWRTVFPAMVNVHLLIGLVEALVTALVVAAIRRIRPELVEPEVPPAGSVGRGQVLGYGVLISLGLALFVSPFACQWPDGLERVANTLGFAPRAAGHPLAPAPLRDYHLPGVASATVATSLAGAIGTLAALALAFVMARVLVPAVKADASPAVPEPGKPHPGGPMPKGS